MVSGFIGSSSLSSHKYIKPADTGEHVSVTWSTTLGRARNRISMHNAEKKEEIRREKQLPVLLLEETSSKAPYLLSSASC